MKTLALFIIGIAAGALITLQSMLNAALGAKAGNLGSVLTLTLVSVAVLLLLIPAFPSTANFKGLPGPSEWYLYIGGALGVAILAAPILLIPKIGATLTLTAMVLGQLLMALLIDHWGLFNAPRIEINLARIIGLALLIMGAVLIKR